MELVNWLISGNQMKDSCEGRAMRVDSQKVFANQDRIFGAENSHHQPSRACVKDADPRGFQKSPI
jgi:hypothetical protein